MKKERVDVLCVEQGLFDSREKAKRGIMAGLVHDEHDRLDKPGTKIPSDTKLYIKGKKMPYVSRGGLKLEKAIDYFHLDLNHLTMLDIGSSTGGFCDCALQHGASYIYAVDVGTNQLNWKIRSDERVCVKENTNFRYASSDMFDKVIDFASIDVSFISLKHIFPPLSEIIKDQGIIVALIKPQFEARKEQVGKHGIIKDQTVHKEVIEKVIEYGRLNHIYIQDLTYSPITGGEGNIEFLGLFKNNGHLIDIDVDSLIEEAHHHFKG